MRAEDILNALPVTFYVVDLNTQVLIESNDPKVTAGKKACYKQILYKQPPCAQESASCLCILPEEQDGSPIIVEHGLKGNRKYIKAEIKKINNNSALISITDITREKFCEKENKITNIRLERAENLASFGSWEMDLNTGKMFATKGAAVIYGMNEICLPFDEVKKIPLPEYRKALDQEMEDLIAGRKNYNIQFKIKRPVTGEIRYVHSVAEYRRDKQMVFGVIHDITEIVHYEQALHETISDLKMAQNIARLGNWKYDPENNTLTVSGQVNQILAGFEIPRAPRFEHFEKLIEPGQFAFIKKAFIKAGIDGKPFEKQVAIGLPDGTRKWIEIICQPDEDKNAGGFVLRGTVQDITITKTTENELQHSNNLFRTLIQTLPDAIYMKDVQGKKIIANEGDARNCGRQHVEQVLGKTDYELYPEEIARNYSEDDRQVIEQGKIVLNREELLPGNPDRWILTTKVPLRDDQGQTLGLVGIGHDITHRKKMEEELKSAMLKAEESDRLKSVFLANMSHEIRTPLNGILGFSSLISSGKVEPGQLSYYAHIIDNCGNQLTSLIDDIIDVSLIQTNQLKLSFSRFNLAEMLWELFAFYKNQKKEQLSNIHFRLNNLLTSNSAVFYSDRQRIYQILKNLLDNAFKFTSSGYIEFGCFLSGQGELNLFVEDSGIGIEESKHEIIFDNFRQVEEGLSRHYEGAGIGLAIVAGIVKQLGGNIKVNSRSGVGSAFYVSLPSCNEGEMIKDDERVDARFETELEKQVEKKHIVSFEDDPASIEYMKSVVQLLGCSIMNFDNPVQGIEYVRKNKIDLILMDVRLPEMSGFEATKIIKSEFPNLPVIIQTAYAMKEDREKAFYAGCDDYLAKPVPLKDLRARIRHFIGDTN